MPHDDLDHIPSIVPTREGMPQRSTNTRAKTTAPERSRGSGARQAPAGGGAGMLARVFIAMALVAAVAACAFAWQLQMQLRQANEQLASYATRIGDLEARLSDTDEGMNQNAETQADRLAKLDSEVRKLWDNVWKETRDRLGKLDAAATGQGKSIKALEGSLSSNQSQLKELSADVTRLKSVSGDLARLMESAKSNQAEVERIADNLNRMNLSLARLEKRAGGNEEWERSVDAFRKQVNASLGELQAAVRALQSPPQ